MLVLKDVAHCYLIGIVLFMVMVIVNCIVVDIFQISLLLVPVVSQSFYFCYSNNNCTDNTSDNNANGIEV